MSASKILVADPDVPLLQALAVHLRSEWYEVALAQNAEQAAERARQDQPDVLVVNIDLPTAGGTPGREAVEEAIDRKTTPVIYLANGPSARHEETARLSGTVSLLTKPFEPDELTDRIRTALAIADRQKADRQKADRQKADRQKGGAASVS